MSKHFRENYDSFNEIYLWRIVNGGSLKEQIDHLLHVASEYIKRAKIANEAERALKLNSVIQKINHSKENVELIFSLINELGDKHDLVHDDLFIVAAYENFAKAILLRKQCLVHKIRDPEELKKLQKKKPIHFRTIKSKKHVDGYYLEHQTIGINELLQSAYVQKIGLSDGELYSLKRCRNMRNNIHFGGVKIYSYDTKLYKGIAVLRDRICRADG